MSAVPAHWIRPRRIQQEGAQRAGVLADVQLICGAGPFELDVLLREYEGPSGIEVTGQVTRADALHEPVPRVELFLLEARTDSPTSVTETDEFGEFDFDRQPEATYGLRLGARPDAPCVLLFEGEA